MEFRLGPVERIVTVDRRSSGIGVDGPLVLIELLEDFKAVLHRQLLSIRHDFFLVIRSFLLDTFLGSLAGRVGRREGIAPDAPFAVVALFEDKEFLISFCQILTE
jgi:hypothetical protein